MRFNSWKGYVTPFLFTCLFLYAGAETRNFLILHSSKDGLRELRISHRSKQLMETTDGSPLSTGSLAFTRVTDGFRLVESVYRFGLLTDCVVSTSRRDIRSFISEFTRVLPGKFDSTVDEIATVYHNSTHARDFDFDIKSGNGNSTADVDSVISLPHTSDSHSNNNGLHNANDETTFLPSLGASSSTTTTTTTTTTITTTTTTTPQWKLSAKLSSNKHHKEFLNKYRDLMRIRKRVRECQRFHEEAEYRLLVLSSPSVSPSISSEVTAANVSNSRGEKMYPTFENIFTNAEERDSFLEEMGLRQHSGTPKHRAQNLPQRRNHKNPRHNHHRHRHHRKQSHHHQNRPNGPERRRGHDAETTEKHQSSYVSFDTFSARKDNNKDSENIPLPSPPLSTDSSLTSLKAAHSSFSSTLPLSSSSSSSASASASSLSASASSASSSS
ncbi:myb-like protein A [Aplysia californica]|uniref:Myb-like protein A n=1 Tax=Aplysia californica TaxID=6500 RepID=A0ABM1A6F6_APLCA|nr:myb-like protein A [Aplysia californica]